MPKIPAGGNPQPQAVHPQVDAQVPTPAVTDDDALSTALGWPTSAPPVENQYADLDETQLRAAAAELGLDFDASSPDDRNFFALFARGDLASLPADGDPDNPLIPAPIDTEAATTTAPAPTPADLDGAPQPSTQPESASGSSPESSGGVGVPGPPPDTSTASTPADPTAIIPPAVPPPPEYVEIPGVGRVPVAQVQAMYQQAMWAQQNQFPPAPLVQPAPQPPAQPQPGIPAVDVDEYIDPRAAADIAALNARYAELAGSQRQMAERMLADNNAALERALVDGVAKYQAARGLTPEEVDELTTSMNTLGTLPAYARMYEGEPANAIMAALDSIYWNTPKYRDRETQRTLATHQVVTAAVDEKKANNAGLVSSPGNVTRTPAPPSTREERDAGFVAAIEQAQRAGELA